MIDVQQWAEIRRLCLAQGWKKRAIARRLGLQRRTIDRALASEVRRGTGEGACPPTALPAKRTTLTEASR